MAHGTLVGFDVDGGRELLTILDAAGVNIDVALWAMLADYDDPRLVLAGRRLDQTNHRNAIEAIVNAIRASDRADHWFPSFLVYRLKEPFIQDLRRLFSKTSSVAGMRLGGQSFGGRYVEDGYIYRIR